MRWWMRVLIVGLLLVVPAVPVYGQAVVPCEFATRGEGLKLLVGLRGPAGSALWVFWGDGTDSVSGPIAVDGGRTAVTHEYAGSGQYRLGVSTYGAGPQCQMGFTAAVPYRGGTDAESRAILAEVLSPRPDDAVEGQGRTPVSVVGASPLGATPEVGSPGARPGSASPAGASAGATPGSGPPEGASAGATPTGGPGAAAGSGSAEGDWLGPARRAACGVLGWLGVGRGC